LLIVSYVLVNLLKVYLDRLDRRTVERSGRHPNEASRHEDQDEDDEDEDEDEVEVRARGAQVHDPHVMSKHRGARMLRAR
jgi:hypothetical protein